LAASRNVVSRSELGDGASASRLCEAGPSSGKGSGLALVVVLAASVVVGGVVVGGDRGVDALSGAGGSLKTFLRPHAFCVSNLSTRSSRTGLA
jgi:hypothetical protein